MAKTKWLRYVHQGRLGTEHAGGTYKETPTPQEIVSRQEDPSFASPFCDLLADWTRKGIEGAWPRERSFDAEDMATAEVCIRYGGGDPRWDSSYMHQCLAR